MMTEVDTVRRIFYGSTNICTVFSDVDRVFLVNLTVDPVHTPASQIESVFLFLCFLSYDSICTAGV